jgi:DNA-binding HxlR family transcriptional regulator
MRRMKQNKTTASDNCKRSLCPVACMLDTLGDKWTLLVVRDIFFGKHTFKELQQSPEKIPSNILADRLKRLQQEKIIDKTLYQERPKRYAYNLTQKGLDLKPVMQSLIAWSNKYNPDTYDMSKV